MILQRRLSKMEIYFALELENMDLFFCNGLRPKTDARLLSEQNMISSIQDFHDQKLSFAMLLRRLSQHEWLLPSIEEQPFLQQVDDELFLSLSTSREAFSKAHPDLEVKPIIQNFTWIFENLPEDLEGFLIDLNSEHALQIPSQYFSFCQQILECSKVENVFKKETSQEDLLSTLRAYPSYLLAIIQDEEGTANIALAPDHQNRQLIAVFTAPDCFQAFEQAAEGKLGDLTIDEVSGEKLFANLSQLPIDGLVFNCYGPVQPQAIGKMLIDSLGEIKK